MAASEAVIKRIWLKKFVTEFVVVPSVLELMKIYCNNSAAIAQAKEPRSHQNYKPIKRRFNQIHESVQKGS
jgi:hypothetical protein